MRVTVRAFANLRDYAPLGTGSAELSLAEGASVADLLTALRIPPAVQTVLPHQRPPGGRRNPSERRGRSHAFPAAGRRIKPAPS